MNKDYLKYFPDYKPYPNQITVMEAIHEAFIKKQIVLFEGEKSGGKATNEAIRLKAAEAGIGAEAIKITILTLKNEGVIVELPREGEIPAYYRYVTGAK